MFVLVFGLGTVTANAASKSYSHNNKYLVGIPSGGWVTVNVTYALREGYENTSSTKRTFNNRCRQAYFSSPNDKFLLKKLSVSVTGVTHYKANDSKIGSATWLKNNKDQIIYGSSVFKVFHNDSTNSLVHDRGTASYAHSSYVIGGVVNPQSQSIKFTNMGK
jgi:hypothetical protein